MTAATTLAGPTTVDRSWMSAAMAGFYMTLRLRSGQAE